MVVRNMVVPCVAIGGITVENCSADRCGRGLSSLSLRVFGIIRKVRPRRSKRSTHLFCQENLSGAPDHCDVVSVGPGSDADCVRPG
jgi:hypothetical protein